jgi:dipeptidyl aminopeptidase/acylaminoacyl peptidase
MHDDIVDGVNWLIQNGIADPQSIGICGTSYGGYEALVGLSFSPELFACGVDVCGPANLEMLLKSVPEYWKGYMLLWYTYVGNPSNPADVQKMQAKSPYFHVHKIKSPVLIVHGYNDPRVDRRYVKEMVSALKNADKEVEFLEFVDEGHGIYRWRNRMDYYRKLESFLAEHLGGRCGGFDFSQWKE